MHFIPSEAWRLNQFAPHPPGNDYLCSILLYESSSGIWADYRRLFQSGLAEAGRRGIEGHDEGLGHEQRHEAVPGDGRAAYKLFV